MAHFCIINGCISTVLVVQSIGLVCHVIAITYVAEVWKDSRARKYKLQNLAIFVPLVIITLGCITAIIAEMVDSNFIKFT